MTTQFRIDHDISQWLLLEEAIIGLIDSIPKLKEQYFQEIRDDLDLKVRQQIQIQNIDDTQTYSKSLDINLIGSGNNVSLHVGFIPIGPEQERLPIYWKTIEFGSNPIRLVPRFKLGAWGARKLGSPILGFAVASKISKFGVLPHPILSRFFILSEPDGNVLDLTNETKSIVDDAGLNLLRNFGKVYSTILSTGRRVARIRGRFASL